MLRQDFLVESRRCTSLVIINIRRVHRLRMVHLGLFRSGRCRMTQLLRAALLGSILASLREAVLAPAAVLVEQVLRRRLATESLIGGHMGQVVRVASLLVFIGSAIVDTLIITIMVVHHGVVKMLLLMQRVILVVGTLGLFKGRALTHK